MSLANGIILHPAAPIVFAIDRTSSMNTRDCPDGMSRWEFARGAVREAINELRAVGRTVTLVLFGRVVQVIEDATASDLNYNQCIDDSCCTGQAASEAIYFAAPNGAKPQGGVIIISDGLPHNDTRVGRVFLSSPAVMRELFSRTIFLTVGQVPADVQLFASTWPNHNTLEAAMRGRATNYGPSDPGQYPPMSADELKTRR